jgi:DNA-binding PadR family transcriptional regulator
MQYQQHAQESLSHPALLILVSLAQEPKHAIALQEVIEQAEGLYIEPGTLYRVLAQLEQRGWIEALKIEQPLRLYQITIPGRLAIARAGAGGLGERFQEGGHPGLRKRKEIIMRLVLWILRFYPPGWRERYEAEMIALLEQHQITLWTVLDLLMGALDARLDPHYRRARQLLPLRRFQTSWRLVVVGLVAFWIALLPWFWMSVLGIPSDTRCSDWQNNNALCMLRVTVGMHATSLGQTLVGALLPALPLLLMAFLAILVLARGKKARTHLLLILPVTIGMLVLCLACAGWLAALWPLLPQISQFYPHATAGLLAGLVGMGLATLLALGSLARAAFALKALSAASPKQESRPFSSDQQASEAAQDTNPPHVELPTASASRRGASRVSKRWRVVLVALLLLFAFPLPLLVPFDGSGLLLWLITWCPAGIVALITALLVKSPGKQQAQRASRKPRPATVPKEGGLFLLVLLLVFTFERLGQVILPPFVPILTVNLLLLMAISILPALIVKRRNSNQQVESATEPVRNSLSPRVWIIVTPILFLVFCMYFEFLFMPDYPDFSEALITWFLTGLASLIILLALKLGSRASTALPNQELPQQAYEQG